MYLYDNWVEVDGSPVHQPQLRIIDDTNLEGNFGQRRLKLKAAGAPLFKLSKAIFFLGDLIKISKPSMYFIDATGRLFTYKKENRAKLKFYKVSKVINIPTGGVIIEVEGLSQRFKSLFAPTIPLHTMYAGLLQTGLTYTLYGLYDTKHTDTWRLV